MAEIEKSEESGPHLFFEFTYKYVPKLFLGPPWAEKPSTFCADALTTSYEAWMTQQGETSSHNYTWPFVLF